MRRPFQHWVVGISATILTLSLMGFTPAQDFQEDANSGVLSDMSVSVFPELGVPPVDQDKQGERDDVLVEDEPAQDESRSDEAQLDKTPAHVDATLNGDVTSNDNEALIKDPDSTDLRVRSASLEEVIGREADVKVTPGKDRDAGNHLESFSVHGVLVSDGGKPGTEVRLMNSHSHSVRFVLPIREVVLADVVVAAGSASYLRVELPAEENNVKNNKLLEYELFSEQVGAVSGVLAWKKIGGGTVLLAAGWGINYNESFMFVDNCSVVKWFYDKRNAPVRGRKMGHDVRDAFKVLASSQIGLRFKEVNLERDADIIVQWVPPKDLSEHGFSGRMVASAGFSGDPLKRYVRFSGGVKRLEDRFAGREPVAWKFANGAGVRVQSGRVWVLVHEIMHLLGFEHMEIENSVMSSLDLTVGVIGLGLEDKKKWSKFVVSGFSRGDLIGLQTIYPKSAC